MACRDIVDLRPTPRPGAAPPPRSRCVTPARSPRGPTRRDRTVLACVAAPTLVSGPVAEPPPGKRRLHIDVNPTDRPQDAERERLLGPGAVRADVGQTGDEGRHVLADPEGNEFCLLKRRLDPLAKEIP